MKMTLKAAEQLNKAVEKLKAEYAGIETYGEDASVHVRFTKNEFLVLIAVLKNLNVEVS